MRGHWMEWLLALGLLAGSGQAGAPTGQALIEQTQREVLGYFWHECAPNGLVQERLLDRQLTSAAAGGMHLTALSIAAARGWAPRPEIAERVVRALRTYQRLPRFQGFFARYYHVRDETAWALADDRDDGADVVESAYLFAGMLTARAVFNQPDDPVETEIRALATELFEAADWAFMLGDAEGRTRNTLAWNWSPTHGFALGARVTADAELSALLAYVLAIGSPTHPIPGDCWWTGWGPSYTLWTAGEATFLACPPLYTHLLAHVWLDLRQQRDMFADYWRNSERAVRANRDYCRAQLYPEEVLWGLSATQGPGGYTVYGYPPRRGPLPAEPVIVPPLAIAALPFAPRDAFNLLRHVQARYPDTMWGPYGPGESMSPAQAWFNLDVVAVSQGALLALTENYLARTVWQALQDDPDLRRGLQRIGFEGLIEDFEPPVGAQAYGLWETSARYSVRRTRTAARRGAHALEVTLAAEAAGQPEPLALAPARRAFPPYRFLATWQREAPPLDFMVEDTAGQQIPLEPAGRHAGEDGWQRVFYRWPQADGQPFEWARLLLRAPPGATGTFWLDDLTLTWGEDLTPPAAVAELVARPGRMPGEALLSWRAEPRGQVPALGTEVRLARRPPRTPAEREDALRIEAPTRLVAPGTHRLHVAGLERGATYHFLARRESASGLFSPWSEISSVTLPRETPPEVFWLDRFDGRADLNWVPLNYGLRGVTIAPFALQGAASLRIEYEIAEEADLNPSLAADLDIRNLTAYGFLTFWVHGRALVQPALVGGNGQVHFAPAQQAALENGWSPLSFALEQFDGLDPRDVRRLIIVFQPGIPEGQGVIHLDQPQLRRNRL